MSKYEIDPVHLNTLLTYCADTGTLYWKTRDIIWFTGDNSNRTMKIWNTKYAGKKAFTAPIGSGYLQGSITYCGVKTNYLAHRVCFAHYHGYWPTIIDHRNGIKTDNRIKNLRDGCSQENAQNRPMMRNNTSGVTGVSKKISKGNVYWMGQIKEPCGRTAFKLFPFDNGGLVEASSWYDDRKYDLGYLKTHGRSFQCA